MVHDLSQDTAPAVNGQQTPRQAVAGLTPPQLAEAMIREVWPSVRSVSTGIAGLSANLMRSVFLAPLGWMLNSLLFGRKFAPVLCQRYTLTNRRLMVRRGWKPAPVQEIPLTDIDDVRLIADSYDAFYRSGDLQVLSGGKEVMKLVSVPEPESFRLAIVNAVKSWGGPDKLKGPFVPASAPSK
ncbi:MAG TPA: PH domain-containing protein [Gemmataceae bacterium]|nr:PH domain-containing protein [Gemmataceae bacterium]